MGNCQITGMMVAAAYAVVIAVGLKTREIIMPPVFSFKRDQDPDAFWGGVAADTAIALFAVSVALR